MLARTRHGAASIALRESTERLSAGFAATGYTPIDVPNLFEAERLLDVYGEDIRARAFLMSDPENGAELCLRPDFTVPIALAHAARGWPVPAAYTCAGPVFRRQSGAETTGTEHLQVGIERFGDADLVTAETDVFGAVLDGVRTLTDAPLDITVGDLGLLLSAIDAIAARPHLRHALRRHLWRPKRFQTLLETGLRSVPAIESAGGAEPVGARTIRDVAAGLAMRAEAAAEPALGDRDRRLLAALLEISCPLADAANRIAAVLSDEGFAAAIPLDRLTARHGKLLSRAGPDVAMTFDAGFGRRLEYYDGVVFEITAADRADLRPLAGGGRYDALTVRLGAPTTVPAVGAMIRPEAVLET